MLKNASCVRFPVERGAGADAPSARWSAQLPLRVVPPSCVATDAAREAVAGVDSLSLHLLGRHVGNRSHDRASIG
jgi:hypothetical protein